MLAVSCSKESELSKDNAGKERPVVTIEQNKVHTAQQGRCNAS